MRRSHSTRSRSITERIRRPLCRETGVRQQKKVNINGSRTIRGWAVGISADSADMLRFANLTGVHLMIEGSPFEKSRRGLRAMASG